MRRWTRERQQRRSQRVSAKHRSPRLERQVPRRPQRAADAASQSDSSCTSLSTLRDRLTRTTRRMTSSPPRTPAGGHWSNATGSASSDRRGADRSRHRWNSPKARVVVPVLGAMVDIRQIPMGGRDRRLPERRRLHLSRRPELRAPARHGAQGSPQPEEEPVLRARRGRHLLRVPQRLVRRARHRADRPRCTSRSTATRRGSSASSTPSTTRRSRASSSRAPRAGCAARG